MPRLKELQNYTSLEEKRKRRNRLIELKKRHTKRIRALNMDIACEIERKQNKKPKAQTLGSNSSMSDNGAV